MDQRDDREELRGDLLRAVLGHKALGDQVWAILHSAEFGKLIDDMIDPVAFHAKVGDQFFYPGVVTMANMLLTLREYLRQRAALEEAAGPPPRPRLGVPAALILPQAREGRRHKRRAARGGAAACLRRRPLPGLAFAGTTTPAERDSGPRAG